MSFSQYTESFDWLETNCELIGTGKNKRVYYNNKNNIVFKLFKDKAFLYNELRNYRILTENKINFFIPKTKFLNKFVFISQYANPIKVTNDLAHVFPDSNEWIDCNFDIINSKIKLLSKDPIKNNDIWNIICTKTQYQEEGLTTLYNWGIRKNKIVLLDFEMVNMKRTLSYLLEPKNADKFRQSLNIHRYY